MRPHGRPRLRGKKNIQKNFESIFVNVKSRIGFSQNKVYWKALVNMYEGKMKRWVGTRTGTGVTATQV